MNTIKTWSFSSLKKFEQCPHSQYLKRVVRLAVPKPAEDSPLVRGLAIHKEAEDFVNGTLPKLPTSLRKLEGEFLALRDLFNDGIVTLEEQWGFDKDWTPCGYLDWGTVWFQCALDAAVYHDKTTATVIDHKTGKSFGNEVSHGQQGQLYAIALMVRNPELEGITVEFWYTDEGKIKRKSYSRKLLTPIMASFTKRGVKMTTETQFKPKPNKMNCKYCDFGIANGNGMCEFGVDPTL
jgi:RecB family exonuclease